MQIKPEGPKDKNTSENSNFQIEKEENPESFEEKDPSKALIKEISKLANPKAQQPKASKGIAQFFLGRSTVQNLSGNEKLKGVGKVLLLALPLALGAVGAFIASPFILLPAALGYLYIRKRNSIRNTVDERKAKLLNECEQKLQTRSAKLQKKIEENKEAIKGHNYKARWSNTSGLADTGRKKIFCFIGAAAIVMLAGPLVGLLVPVAILGAKKMYHKFQENRLNVQNKAMKEKLEMCQYSNMDPLAVTLLKSIILQPELAKSLGLNPQETKEFIKTLEDPKISQKMLKDLTEHQKSLMEKKAAEQKEAEKQPEVKKAHDDSGLIEKLTLYRRQKFQNYELDLIKNTVEKHAFKEEKLAFKKSIEESLNKKSRPQDR